MMSGSLWIHRNRSVTLASGLNRLVIVWPVRSVSLMEIDAILSVLSSEIGGYSGSGNVIWNCNADSSIACRISGSSSSRWAVPPS